MMSSGRSAFSIANLLGREGGDDDASGTVTTASGASDAAASTTPLSSSAPWPINATATNSETRLSPYADESRSSMDAGADNSHPLATHSGGRPSDSTQQTTPAFFHYGAHHHQHQQPPFGRDGLPANADQHRVPPPPGSVNYPPHAQAFTGSAAMTANTPATQFPGLASLPPHAANQQHEPFPQHHGGHERMYGAPYGAGGHEFPPHPHNPAPHGQQFFGEFGGHHDQFGGIYPQGQQAGYMAAGGPPTLGKRPLLPGEAGMMLHSDGGSSVDGQSESKMSRYSDKDESPVFTELTKVPQSHHGVAPPVEPVVLKMPADDGGQKPNSKARKSYTKEQMDGLEAAFQQNQFCTGIERTKLSQHLSLAESQICNWFQNRRGKERRRQKALAKQNGGVPPPRPPSSNNSNSNQGGNLPLGGEPTNMTHKMNPMMQNMPGNSDSMSASLYADENSYPSRPSSQISANSDSLPHPMNPWQNEHSFPYQNQHYQFQHGQQMQSQMMPGQQMPGGHHQMPGSQQMPGRQTGQHMSGQMPEQHMSDKNVQSQRMSEQQRPTQDGGRGPQIPPHPIQGQQMPGHQMPGQSLPGHQLPGQPMPGHQMPGQPMPGHQMPRMPSHQMPAQMYGQEMFGQQMDNHSHLMNLQNMYGQHMNEMNPQSPAGQGRLPVNPQMQAMPSTGGQMPPKIPEQYSQQPHQQGQMDPQGHQSRQQHQMDESQLLQHHQQHQQQQGPDQSPRHVQPGSLPEQNLNEQHRSLQEVSSQGLNKQRIPQQYPHQLPHSQMTAPAPTPNLQNQNAGPLGQDPNYPELSVTRERNPFHPQNLPSGQSDDSISDRSRPHSADPKTEERGELHERRPSLDHNQTNEYNNMSQEGQGHLNKGQMVKDKQQESEQKPDERAKEQGQYQQFANQGQMPQFPGHRHPLSANWEGQFMYGQGQYQGQHMPPQNFPPMGPRNPYQPQGNASQVGMPMPPRDNEQPESKPQELQAEQPPQPQMMDQQYNAPDSSCDSQSTKNYPSNDDSRHVPENTSDSITGLPQEHRQPKEMSSETSKGGSPMMPSDSNKMVEQSSKNPFPFHMQQHSNAPAQTQNANAVPGQNDMYNRFFWEQQQMFNMQHQQLRFPFPNMQDQFPHGVGQHNNPADHAEKCSAGPNERDSVKRDESRSPLNTHSSDSGSSPTMQPNKKPRLAKPIPVKATAQHGNMDFLKYSHSFQGQWEHAENRSSPVSVVQNEANKPSFSDESEEPKQQTSTDSQDKEHKGASPHYSPSADIMAECKEGAESKCPSDENMQSSSENDQDKKQGELGNVESTALSDAPSENEDKVAESSEVKQCNDPNVESNLPEIRQGDKLSNSPSYHQNSNQNKEALETLDDAKNSIPDISDNVGQSQTAGAPHHPAIVNPGFVQPRDKDNTQRMDKNSMKPMDPMPAQIPPGFRPDTSQAFPFGEPQIANPPVYSNNMDRGFPGHGQLYPVPPSLTSSRMYQPIQVPSPYPYAHTGYNIYQCPPLPQNMTDKY